MTKRYHAKLIPPLLLLILLFHKDVVAQKYIDTIPTPPTTADTNYLDEEVNIKTEDTQEYQDSLRRAKANAFERIDTVKNTPLPDRNIKQGFIQKLKNDPTFSYVKKGIPKPKLQKQKNKPIIDVENIFLIVAIVAFVVFLLWYLSEKNLLFFRRKSKLISTENEQIDETNIFSINYADAIHKALLDNNYRLAIRLQYLRLLKQLGDRGIIKYQPDKTNFDYLLQLKPTNYYSGFQSITRNYEYTWYGLFDIDAAKYKQITGLFSDFEKNIGAQI